MRPDDFYIDDPLGPGPDRQVDTDLLRELRRGPLAERGDIEVGVALARLVHDELERFGTGRSAEMAEQDMRDALLALRAIVDRLGVREFDPPFRDFSTFKSYWAREGAAGGGTFRGIVGRGGCQARRDLLAETVDPLHDRLAELESQSLSSTLADPINPRSRTGWARVDAEQLQLRARQDVCRPFALHGYLVVPAADYDRDLGMVLDVGVLAAPVGGVEHDLGPVGRRDPDERGLRRTCWPPRSNNRKPLRPDEGHQLCSVHVRESCHQHVR